MNNIVKGVMKVATAIILIVAGKKQQILQEKTSIMQKRV